ncbi:TetR/AcrR family transcriptional regulator [Virgibacillus halodenitrificans]|uniref:TetR/AcrR family transcriptional regulator n=1 Tax=Virgibacillus halodenitrificans TaxID=1482 RepID=UPI0002E03EF3|nr:TetR/AcrR family transcriptional regulator [Virgibacillus halodenitrificans]
MDKKPSRPLGRPKSTQQKQPTNELILQAASTLFMENSFADVSMDDVASASNVTKATVYYYYKTKSDLYTDAMVKLMYRVRKQIIELLRQPIELKTKLQQVAEVYLQIAVHLDMDFFIQNAKSMLDHDQIKAIHTAEDYMYEGMEEVFEEAIANGEIRQVNPAFTVHSYISLLNAGNYQNANGDTLFTNSQEAAKEIVDFFWRSVMIDKS